MAKAAAASPDAPVPAEGKSLSGPVAGDFLAPGYRVVAHLDRADTLDIYDAWSVERECRCIAKALRRDRPNDRQAAQALRREADLLARLVHPNIVRAYEYIAAPLPALILEMLSGETLEHLIDRQARRLPLGDIIQLGLQLCSAVGYLHRQDTLHLDLKPANIIAECGRAKVIDLGIAQPPGRGRRGVGTDPYMAPEQVRGDVLGPAADVWGLGTVLYEATAGQRPFEHPDPQFGYEQLRRRAAPLRAHRRLPATFATAIDRCLDPDPAQRPSIAELTATLRALLPDEASTEA